MAMLEDGNYFWRPSGDSIRRVSGFGIGGVLKLVLQSCVLCTVLCTPFVATLRLEPSSAENYRLLAETLQKDEDSIETRFSTQPVLFSRISHWAYSTVADLESSESELCRNHSSRRGVIWQTYASFVSH